MTRFSRPLLRAGSMLACVLCLTLSRAARAEDPNTRSAVALAYQGRELFDAGEHARALEKFKAAKTLAHSPVFDLYVARCYRALGKLVDGLAAYSAMLQHELAADAPPAWVEARAAAATELEQLEREVPRVNLRSSENAELIQVRIDGVLVAAPFSDLPIDPGEHHITARSGQRQFSETFFARTGEVTQVVLRFDHTNAAAASSPKRSDPVTLARPVAADVHGGRGFGPAVWTSFGVAAAGLVTGATLGTIAWSKAAGLEDHCENNPCPGGEPEDPDRRAEQNETRRLATFSTIGFAVGLAGAAVGVTLLVLPGSSPSTQPRVIATGRSAALKFTF